MTRPASHAVLGRPYSHVSPLRNLDFRSRRSFLAEFQNHGRFLNPVATQKVTSRLRGFGTVFIFSGATGRFAILMIVSDHPRARVARIFSKVLACLSLIPQKFLGSEELTALWAVS